ncbi:MAG: recombination protein RecR [Clostridia bacterium]|nr:recombination protein RecR [Clostridia bacterium]
MEEYIEPLEELIDQFRRLSGIGRKTAVRLAFSVVNYTDEQAEEFASAVLRAKKEIGTCPVCQNLSVAGQKCPVCSDPGRDRSTICVVEDSRTVMSMERVREYKGVYHVLHGVLSPSNGVTPDMLRIGELLSRLDDGTVKEVIIATNPTVDGETTAMYISRLLRDRNVKVSRLAYGIPVGGDLEYADEITLFRALEGRTEMMS